jgi:glucose-1-phosphate adenylyltransferase
VNSGIRSVGVATQHKPDALIRHLDTVWRTTSWQRSHHIEPWPAEQCAPGWGYRGTADAVFRNLDVIERPDCRLVVILAGDHVYKMDYRPMLAYHCEKRADVTVACIDVPVGQAHQFGIVSVDEGGRIACFVEKPKTPAELPAGLPAGTGVTASMGIYVFDVDFLGRVLRRDALSGSSKHDFGGDILPDLLDEAGVYAFPFRTPDGQRPGYWRDVGTPEAYWRAHMELLGPSSGLVLDDPLWPLPAVQGAPRLVARRAGPAAHMDACSSLLADGCEIRGTVRQSVLFPGVEVRRGASVAEAVILPDATIGKDCRLRGVIVDSGCHVPEGTVIDGWAPRRSPPRRGPIVVARVDLPRSLSMYGSASVRSSSGGRLRLGASS